MKHGRQSQRLSQRLTEYRSLSNQLFIEDMVIYSAVMLSSLGYDLFYNFLHSVGLVLLPRPFNVGIGQLTVFGAFGILLMRRIAHWKRFKNGGI